MRACLHRSLVHEHAVQIFGRFHSRICFRKDDGSNAETASTLVVSHQYSSDWPNGFGKIFLCAVGS